MSGFCTCFRCHLTPPTPTHTHTKNWLDQINRCTSHESYPADTLCAIPGVVFLTTPFGSHAPACRRRFHPETLGRVVLCRLISQHEYLMAALAVAAHRSASTVPPVERCCRRGHPHVTLHCARASCATRVPCSSQERGALQTS